MQQLLWCTQRTVRTVDMEKFDFRTNQRYSAVRMSAWKPDGTDLQVCISTVPLIGVEELTFMFRNQVTGTNLGPTTG
jgi:hypothetical protein